MSLRDELEPNRRFGPPCAVGVWLSTADQEWRELMADATIRHIRLFRLAQKHGYVNTDVTFRRHRNGECGCDPAD